MINNRNFRLRYLTFIALLLCSITAFAQSDKDFPPRPNPPHLVNDLAHMMDAGEVQQLEQKLEDFDKTTSTQITVVTVKNLGGYDIAQYAVELGNRWGVGNKGKDNGVLVLASVDDRKVNISTGYGLEGALTDATSGQIIRNEITPSFRDGNYYEGFDKGTDAIIKATKGEYTADADYRQGKHKRTPVGTIIIIVIIVVVLASKIGGGGGGGGTYMSGRGRRGFASGWIIGNILGGLGSGGFGGGGGRNDGGGGFGGFGGGGFGGGGASGSW